MKAAAYYQGLPTDRPEALIDLTLPELMPSPHDLLVKVRAIPVNPMGTKVRLDMSPVDGQPHVLGWDATGVMRAIGAEVSFSKLGDVVWCADVLQHPGANNELHVIDERVIGTVPAAFGFVQTAVLSLTAITTQELLFDRLQVPESAAPSGKTALIVGAAGGVGLMLVQPTCRLTGLTVIGTISCLETTAWMRELNAHYVINHAQPLAAELHHVGASAVDYIASLNQTEHHSEQTVKTLKPQGCLALIDNPVQLDAHKLKAKSLSPRWEFMYTRSMLGTGGQIEQHRLLNRAATLIDEGALRFTMNKHFGTINATNLKRA